MQLPQTVILDTAFEVGYLMERMNMLPQSSLITLDQLLNWCVESCNDQRMPALPAMLAKINNALASSTDEARMIMAEACISLAAKIHSLYCNNRLWAQNGVSVYSFQGLRESKDITVGLGVTHGTTIHNPDLGVGGLDQSLGLSF